MRRILSLFVCVILFSSMSSCGNSYEEFLEIGILTAQNALDVTDEYLDYKLSAKEAKEKMYSLYQQIKEVSISGNGQLSDYISLIYNELVLPSHTSEIEHRLNIMKYRKEFDEELKRIMIGFKNEYENKITEGIL